MLIGDKDCFLRIERGDPLGARHYVRLEARVALNGFTEFSGAVAVYAAFDTACSSRKPINFSRST